MLELLQLELLVLELQLLVLELQLLWLLPCECEEELPELLSLLDDEQLFPLDDEQLMADTGVKAMQLLPEQLDVLEVARAAATDAAASRDCCSRERRAWVVQNQPVSRLA